MYSLGLAGNQETDRVLALPVATSINCVSRDWKCGSQSTETLPVGTVCPDITVMDDWALKTSYLPVGTSPTMSPHPTLVLRLCEECGRDTMRVIR